MALTAIKSTLLCKSGLPTSVLRGLCNLLRTGRPATLDPLLSSIPCCNALIKSQARSLMTTPTRFDLMEFFDDTKNWGEREVKVGRSWKIDELRLKSNTDLHKLWYVLLKERNMLLTMEHDAKDEYRLFPNPERIDKVEESMKNLEEVVRERNRAFYMLETGTTGERSGEEFENWVGLPEYRPYEEYPVPKEQNKEWFKAQEEVPKSSDIEKIQYFKLLRQKQRKSERRRRRWMMAQIHESFRLYPDLDVEALKQQFPEIDPAKIDGIKTKIKDINLENNVEPHRVTVWGNRQWAKGKLTWKKKFLERARYPH